MPLSQSVEDKLKQLPAKPGCYIYRDEKGEVLYVGKALVLKNRVRSYFQKSTRHGNRIARMVRKVADVEWMVVDSEIEALVLECNLIKRYRPPYNVRLRDDKSYPYITITKEKFPRVLFTRRVRKDGAKYFGPYTNVWSVRESLGLLHKAFPLIPCGKPWSGKAEQRPCLYFHLGQCMAPCAGMADPKAYAQVIGDVQAFLSGKGEGLIKKLTAQMNEAAEALDFEKAAKIRNQIQSLDNILQRQKVLSTDGQDQDVIAVVKDDRGAAIQMLYIRSGKLIGQRQFILDGSSEAAPSEAVGEFVKQYYADAPEVPREVILPVEIEERLIVQQWLRSKRGSAVTVGVPQTGEKMRLVDLAASNAEQALAVFSTEMEQKEAWAENALSELQEALGLPTLPERVECFDISNISGTSPVGSMVVSLRGEPAKAEYRRFHIKMHAETPDDFAMMHEVVLRRLRRHLDGDPKFAAVPDLIVIDGGRGQLAAALTARDALGLSIPMVGLAKKMELLVVATPVGARPDPTEHKGKPGALYTYNDVELPLNSPGLVLVRRLRDEAHRFAISFHRKIRDKRFAASELEEVPGIGPRRKRLLLRTFGSVEGIRRATPEELGSVPTMTHTLAVLVLEHLRTE